MRAKWKIFRFIGREDADDIITKSEVLKNQQYFTSVKQ